MLEFVHPCRNSVQYPHHVPSTWTEYCTVPRMEIPVDLAALGPIFRWVDARDAGITQPRLHRLLDAGAIERVEHGLYARTDTTPMDLDLVEAASATTTATLCLVTALAHHDLVDEIPSKVHLAVPRGHHVPQTSRGLRWHRFARETFEVGRETLDVGAGLTIGLYSPERSIVDAYRLRHIHGVEQAREALRNWLGRRGSSPSSLLTVAERFPKATAGLRSDLKVLL